MSKLESMKKKAEAGDLEAKSELALMYFYEEGDYKEARKWFSKACKGQEEARKKELAELEKTWRKNNSGE